MALSLRLAAPFFVALLLVIVVAETATAREVVEEKHCLSKSQTFDGQCWPWSETNCDTICKWEKFSGGECKMDGNVNRKCFCKKIC